MNINNVFSFIRDILRHEAGVAGLDPRTQCAQAFVHDSPDGTRLLIIAVRVPATMAINELLATAASFIVEVGSDIEHDRIVAAMKPVAPPPSIAYSRSSRPPPRAPRRRGR